MGVIGEIVDFEGISKVGSDWKGMISMDGSGCCRIRWILGR